MKLKRLTDDEVVAAVKRYAAREREAATALDELLGEIDARWPGMRQDWPQRMDDEREVRPGGPANRRGTRPGARR